MLLWVLSANKFTIPIAIGTDKFPHCPALIGTTLILLVPLWFTATEHVVRGPTMTEKSLHSGACSVQSEFSRQGYGARLSTSWHAAGDASLKVVGLGHLHSSLPPNRSPPFPMPSPPSIEPSGATRVCRRLAADATAENSGSACYQPGPIPSATPLDWPNSSLVSVRQKIV